MPVVNPEASDAVSFTQDDLQRILQQRDPRSLTPVSDISDHIVRIPDRDDLCLRWTTADRSSANFPARAEDLQRHADTHELRLGQLSSRGVIDVPPHAAFPVEHCHRLGQPVIYTVVKHFPKAERVNPLTSDPTIISAVGHAILDHHLLDVPIGEPRPWDISKLGQYGIINGRPTLLDLDSFLSRDPRIVYPKMLVWVNSIRSHDQGALSKRTSEAYNAARQAHAENTNNCRAPLWSTAQ